MNKDNNKNYSYSFNVILIGDHLVGKTKLLQTFVQDIGNDEYYGVVFKKKEGMKIKDKDNRDLDIKLSIFDFNGGCRFIEMTKSYYKYPNSFIICYSKDNKESFNNLINYINDINKLYVPSEKFFKGNKPSIVIAGLKSDIPTEESQVDINDVLEFCKSLDIPSIHTVSSKNNIDIEELFQISIQQIYDNGSYSDINTHNSDCNNNNKCIIN